MRKKTALTLVSGVLIGLGALPAAAHVKITSHPMRNSASTIKDPPCGVLNDSRSDNINTFLSGSTITLKFDEFVFHPGYFRISFDPDGDDDFFDPINYPQPDGSTDPIVLLDGLFDGHNNGDGPVFTQDVTLPDIE